MGFRGSRVQIPPLRRETDRSPAEASQPNIPPRFRFTRSHLRQSAVLKFVLGEHRGLFARAPKYRRGTSYPPWGAGTSQLNQDCSTARWCSCSAQTRPLITTHRLRKCDVEQVAIASRLNDNRLELLMLFLSCPVPCSATMSHHWVFFFAPSFAERLAL
jgi:hypothetical protein